MDEAAFRELLKEYLLPMLSGTELGTTKNSKASHSLVAYDNPCALLMKPQKEATYRLELLRSQPFAKEEKKLVELFMDELSAIVIHANTHFFADVMGSLPRRVIGQLLPGQRGRSTLQQAIQQFESLASQTYEGRQIVATLGITGSLGYGSVRLDELWREDFSAVLSNGFDTMYVCGSDGRVFNVRSLPVARSTSYAPHRLGAIANWCNDKKRVAIALNRNGEVLVFNDKKLQFARRRGAWRYYAHDSVVRRLGIGVRKELRRAVYESCLDVSFARTGGCLAVVTRDGGSKVKEMLKHLIGNSEITRTKLLSSAVTKPFHKLDRRLRQELLAMDGATILYHDGIVLTAGEIIKVPGGSAGGGRRAAAVQLSRFGLGVKISSDGPITGFRRKDEIFSI